jgi:hypothetical protein
LNGTRINFLARHGRADDKISSMRRAMKALTILYLMAWFVSDAYQTSILWETEGGISLGAARESFPYIAPPAWSLTVRTDQYDPLPNFILRTLVAEPPRPFTAEYTYSDLPNNFCRRQVIHGWNINGRSVSMTTTDIWIDCSDINAVTAAIAWSIFIPVSFRLRRKFIDFARRRRESRRASLLARHLCPTCGYDLRATPHQCPECGTPTA